MLGEKKNQDYPPEKACASGETKSSQQKAITRDGNEPTEKQEVHRKHTRHGKLVHSHAHEASLLKHSRNKL